MKSTIDIISFPVESNEIQPEMINDDTSRLQYIQTNSSISTASIGTAEYLPIDEATETTIFEGRNLR
jgi:hypothetical protein